MIPSGTRQALLPILAALLFIAADPAAESAPAYTTRLVLPVVNDRFGFPQGVTTDPTTGEIYVCDTRKNRIVIFDDQFQFLYEIQGGRELSSPVDLAVDRDGILFVVANHGGRNALIELDFDGLFRREITLKGLPDEVDEPYLTSVAVSPGADHLYLLDEANVYLWIVNRDGRVTRGVDLAPDSTDEESFDQIQSKVDVYDDRVLLPVPSDGQIRVFDLDGAPVGIYGTSGTGPCMLGFPTAAALDEEGNLVIVDQQRMVLLRWDPRENACLGEYWGIGDLPGFLYYPFDLALDGSGRIFVTQGFEGRVQVYEGLRAAASSAATTASKEPGPDATTEVQAAVRAWAEALEDQDADGFLNTYSSDFLPWGVGDRPGWEQLRRSRIERAEWIEVEIGPIEVELIGSYTARAVFDQAIHSDLFDVVGRRTMILILEHGRWRIIEERVAAAS